MDLLYLPKVLENFNCAKTLLAIEIKNILPSKFIRCYLLSTCYVLIDGDTVIQKIGEVFALIEVTV